MYHKKYRTLKVRFTRLKYKYSLWVFIVITKKKWGTTG